MKISILIAVSIICFISCKKNYRSTILNQEKLKKDEISPIVQLIIDIPEIQWMYHPEIKDRLPIKILKTKQINELEGVTKFDEKVKLFSLSELTSKKLDDYLLITLNEKTKDTVTFKLLYAVEGIKVYGKLIKQDKNWKIRNTNVIEY